MRKWISFAGAAALLWAVGPLSGCRKAEGPTLTLHLKAATPGGEPLSGVAVEALGKPRGTTDAKGELTFTFTADVGDEFTTTARLERPGMSFKPWQQSLVVRKSDPAKPETREYQLEAKLEPAALSSRIEFDTGGAPFDSAEIHLDGKPAKLDADGSVHVDLGQQ